jgi:hypothetical protein
MLTALEQSLRIFEKHRQLIGGDGGKGQRAAKTPTGTRCSPSAISPGSALRGAMETTSSILAPQRGVSLCRCLF